MNSPEHLGPNHDDISSPDIFSSNVRCNLENRYTITLGRNSMKEENMCVYARIRPVLPKEEAKGYKVCIGAVDDHTVRVIVPETSAKYKNSRQCEQIVEDFSFSSAFGSESGQFVFFQETMLNIIKNFVEGGNSLVFSYGITGSGKTYTLQGNSENPGIIPLSLKLYFASIQRHLLQEVKVKPCLYNSIKVLSFEEQKKEFLAKKELLSLYNEECDNAPGSFNISNSKTFAMTLCSLFSDSCEAEERQTTLSPEDMASAQAASLMRDVIRNSADSQQGLCNVWVSFVEIYNENIFDLLVPINGHGMRKRLMLKEHNGNVYIDGAQEICVSSGDEALRILNIGRKNLSVASTKMNYQSSRSHCIYTLRVVRVQDAKNLSTGIVNRLFFCDLAGSERASKTQTSGVRLKEAGSINTSLLVLGRCLEQLRMNQSGRDKRIVPFRESKLTRIFSGFFLGQGSAVMIANASPCDYTFDETLHVLKFSAIARKLKVNETFFSEASSTLKSICNQWSNASNSSINDSVDSIDSYELIKEKDEIIDKLVEVLKQLEKKEKEMAAQMEDMQYRIRQEVIQEYSEYSDQLLEDRRIMYEEQIERLKNNYKKLLDKRDKMYEEALEKYSDQLSETINSEDDMDESSSQLDLENTDESSYEKSKSKKEIEVMTETINNQNEEIKRLNLELSSVTCELEKTRLELIDSQKCKANLEADDKLLKKEVKSYMEQVKTLQKIVENLETESDNFKKQISCLEKEQLSVAEQHKFLLEEKINVVSGLEKENEELRVQMKTMEEQIENSKISSDGYCSEISNYKSKITDLKSKLLLNEKKYQEQVQSSLDSSSELKKVNEQLTKEIASVMEQNKNLNAKYEEQTYSFSNASSELKKENEKLRLEMKALKEKIEDKEKSCDRYNSQISDYQSRITDLESKLLLNENNYKEKNQQSLKESSELEKENSKLKLEMKALKEKIEDMEKCCDRYNSQISDYKSRNTDLESKLLLNEKNYEEKNQRSLDESSEVEKVNEELEREVDALKEEIKKNEEEIHKLKEQIDKNDSNIENQKSIIDNLERKLSLNEKDYADQLQAKSSIACQLKKENCDYKAQIHKLEEDNQRMKELQNSLKQNITEREEKINKLEKDLATLNNIVNILGRCEIKAYEHTTELQSSVTKYLSEIEELNHKMRNKESSIEELERGLFKFQEQLKHEQLSNEQKIMSLKEQHEIEIKETMKVKHALEEENMILKKGNSDLKSVEVKKKTSKSESSLKKSSSSSLKENLPKVPSTRPVRKRPTNLKDISLSSIESMSPEVRQKACKRVSDEDFEPHETRASKKMKPTTAASKIPTRQLRGKLAPGNDENLSPIQKFKNSVTSKVKNISSSISTQLSSPRMTRGKKRLFNPDAPSCSTAKNVSKGRKK